MLSKNNLWRISVMVLAILLVTCGNADAKSGLKSSVRNSRRSVRPAFSLKASLRVKRVTKSKNKVLRPRTNEISFTANKNYVKSIAPLCIAKGMGAGGAWDFDDSEICRRIDDLITAQKETKTAIDSLKQDLTTKIGDMVASNKATQDLIQQQIKQTINFCLTLFRSD